VKFYDFTLHTVRHSTLSVTYLLV